MSGMKPGSTKYLDEVIKNQYKIHKKLSEAKSQIKVGTKIHIKGKSKRDKQENGIQIHDGKIISVNNDYFIVQGNGGRKECFNWINIICKNITYEVVS